MVVNLKKKTWGKENDVLKLDIDPKSHCHGLVAHKKFSIKEELVNITKNLVTLEKKNRL